MKLLRLGEGAIAPLLSAARQDGYSIVTQSKTPVDAVVISGKAAKDVTQAKKALSMNIPVLCATPRASQKVLDALVSHGEKQKTLVYIPYHREVFSPYTALVNQVNDDKIGDVGFIKIHSNQPIPHGYAPGKASPCSEVISESMVHDIDWLNRHFGPIRKVFCQGMQQAKPKTEYAMATFTLNKGVIAQVIHSWQSKVEASLRTEICGTNGMLQYNSADCAIRQTPAPSAKELATLATATTWSNHWASFMHKADSSIMSNKEARACLAPARIAELTAQSAKTAKPFVVSK